MRYNTLLKVTMDSGLWYLIMKSTKFLKIFFQKNGQAAITSFNTLKHITKGYKRIRIQETNYEFVENFQNKIKKLRIRNFVFIVCVIHISSRGSF